MRRDLEDEQFEEDFSTTADLEFDEIDDFDDGTSVELQLLAARVQATRNLGV